MNWQQPQGHKQACDERFTLLYFCVCVFLLSVTLRVKVTDANTESVAHYVKLHESC